MAEAEAGAGAQAPQPDGQAPLDAGETSVRARIGRFREKYATTEAVVFFVAGFLFDVVTMDRIDNWQTLAQQALYLFVLGTLLFFDVRASLGVADPPRLLVRAWAYSEAALHFFFGSLLSSFALFYFKSSSGFASLGFVVALFALLIANELPRFRKRGPVVRIALYSFSVTSYFAYVLPVIFGFISAWLFVLAVLLSSLVVYGMFRLLRRWNRIDRPSLLRWIVPSAAMQVLLVVLYMARLIPPVPVAVQYLGIYHGVERTKGGFALEHQRPDWRFWHHGDQLFRARPGDRIYCFVRMFAPRQFRDRIYMRWAFDDPKQGWLTSDRIPMTLTGGRGEGFRAHAYKANYKPGEYKVTVETEDGREIGSIAVEVQLDSGTDIRDMQVEHR